MKNTDQQDYEEELVFSEFKSVFPISGIILNKKQNQKPDVIIDQGEKKLGIEITELGTEDRKVFGSQREFALSLQNYLNANIADDVEVRLFFKNEDKVIHAKDKAKYSENLGREIIRMVSMQPDKEDGIHQIEISDNDYDIGISTIEILMAYDGGENIYQNSRVIIPSSGWINEYFVDQLIAAIKSKNEKYSEYLKIVDECWLLVYSHTFRPEGQYNFSEKMVSNNFGSLYTKTFFYEYGNRKYFSI